MSNAPAADEVHVWRARLYAASTYVAGYLRTLDAGERARARRLRTPDAQRRFIVGRAVLRELIARYTGTAAQDVLLRPGRNGKPEVVSHGTGPSVVFSHSRSSDVAVYAIALRDSQCGPVGVDVERVWPGFDWEPVAGEFFAESERDAIDSLPAGERRDAFFRCWARKEACLKASGDGLGEGLADLVVPTTREMSPVRVRRAAADLGGGWWLQSFRPADGYAGAVAGEGRGGHVSFWEWTS
jgi:4'-phosphopantetheinyl transferase